MTNLSDDPSKNDLVEVLERDAMVPVMIGSGYYQNFHKLIEYHCKEKGPETLDTALKRFMKQDPPVGEWEEHLYTMLQLVNDFEKQARNAGFFKKITQEEYLALRLQEQN